jgi:hypothetical protein
VSDEQKKETQTPGEAWQDVGKQFQTLGESVAAAFRTAWTSEENRQHLQGMQAGLEAMVNEIANAIKDSATSPDAQKARAEAGRTIHVAGRRRTNGPRSAPPPGVCFAPGQ